MERRTERMEERWGEIESKRERGGKWKKRKEERNGEMKREIEIYLT